MTTNNDAVAVTEMNPISAYELAGERAGRARKNRDEAAARFHTEWMRRAVALESPEYGAKARRAFDDAYRAEATPSVCCR